jgi:acyl carrier protein
MQSAFTTDVRNFVIENFLVGKTDVIKDDDSFLDKGILDSTGILELVSHLEETYGIEITEDELVPENLDSVNKIGAYLSTKLNGTGSNLRATEPAGPQAFN